MGKLLMGSFLASVGLAGFMGMSGGSPKAMMNPSAMMKQQQALQRQQQALIIQEEEANEELARTAQMGAARQDDE